MFPSYKEIKKNQGVVVARSIIRQILSKNNWNITYTASILNCSTKCIRRARDWTLDDYSKAPKTNSFKQTKKEFEDLILFRRKKTHYWRIRLHKHLKLILGLDFPPSTIRNILRRNNLTKYNYKRPAYSSKPLYDYDNILPFQFWQVDTKHIEDFNALWDLCFIPRKYNLPLYQWSYIDVKTKLKFIAYSYTLRPNYWLTFILMVATYLRAMWINYHLNFQADNWPADFCWWSKRKEEEWNNILKTLNSSFKSIPAWKKYLQWVVERSHRTDDEELYRPFLDRMKDISSFLYHSQRYIYTYNNFRQSWWRWMNWVSPIEKLKQSNILYSVKFNSFPIFLLEDIEKIGGTYLKDYYRKSKVFNKITTWNVNYPMWVSNIWETIYYSSEEDFKNWKPAMRFDLKSFVDLKMWYDRNQRVMFNLDKQNKLRKVMDLIS
jgi:hypothetical protein